MNIFVISLKSVFWVKTKLLCTARPNFLARPKAAACRCLYRQLSGNRASKSSLAVFEGMPYETHLSHIWQE